jgi:long-chain acyl-CoA synthetase
MRLTQGLSRSSLLHGQRIASICEGRSRTWREVEQRVARMAGGVQALGLKRGDRVALLGVNSDHYMEAYYAIAWAGCVAVPFNTRWAQAEIAHALRDSAPKALLIDDGLAADIEPLLGVDTVVIRMSDGAAQGSAGALIEATFPIEDSSGEGTDLAAIFYTGGTTGHAKGVMLSHQGIVSNFLAQHAVAPYPEATVFLHIPPLFHMADACCLFGLTMLGSTHVFLPGFDPARTVSAIVEHRISTLFLVPTMIGMLCEELAAHPADMSSIRKLFYGASSISEAVLHRAMRLFPNAAFCQAYGQTELSPVATLLVHQDHLDGILTSAGRPIPQVELRILDEDGRETGPGEVGEVTVRGPGVMLGYWNLPELTRDTIRNGWLRTGDAGYLDASGYLFLVDRVKDMIVSGGENVYSAEVENALLEHPAVLQCAVIGIPDAKWGEAVHAVIRLRDGQGASADDLAAHCNTRIANFKRPKSYEMRRTPLPMSAVGKILKTELRRPFWEGRERSIG